MKTETIKDTIFKTGVKSIPKFIWVFCASYALIMLTNLFVLNFAHIDADKHINRYMDIILSKQEAELQPNKALQEDIDMLYTLIAKNNKEINELKENNQILKENSHPPAK